MAKPEWGKKLSCPSCGARFYDMNKDPAVCPKCETTVEIQQLLKPKRSAPEAIKPKKPVPKVAAVDDDDDDDDLPDTDNDDIDLDDDDDEDLIEDTSDLDEDEDDVAEVKEHIEVDNETDR